MKHARRIEGRARSESAERFFVGLAAVAAIIRERNGAFAARGRSPP